MAQLESHTPITTARGWDANIGEPIGKMRWSKRRINKDRKMKEQKGNLSNPPKLKAKDKGIHTTTQLRNRPTPKDIT